MRKIDKTLREAAALKRECERVLRKLPKRRIDKTLLEVRSWKRKVAAKTRQMTPEQVVAYFNSVTERLLPSPRFKK